METHKYLNGRSITDLKHSFFEDWHPAHPAVLAVGLYDGTVLVYDVRARTKKPIYQSTVRTNKHTDPVWEAAMDRWGTFNHCVFSVSCS